METRWREEKGKAEIKVGGPNTGGYKNNEGDKVETSDSG